MNKTFSVGQAAKQFGVCVRTLQSWDRLGKLCAKRTPTNRRYYTQDQVDAFFRKKRPVVERVVVAYCRVSSQAQRPDLKNQAKAIHEFCVASGLANVEVIEEVGGGLNFKRKKFLELVERVLRGEVSALILAHKDRLARFGFDLLLHLCFLHDCKVLVIDDVRVSPEQEMVQDLMTIVHCFSSRLYGLRNYRKSLQKALKQ